MYIPTGTCRGSCLGSVWVYNFISPSGEDAKPGQCR